MRPDRIDKVGPPQPVLRSFPVLQGLVLLVAMVVLVVLAGREMSTPGQRIVDRLPDARAQGSVLAARPVEAPPVELTAPPPAVPHPVEEVPWDEAPLFDPDLPEGPRRLANRATRYTAPPPGGRFQYEAVTAARSGNCPQALDAVDAGVEVSVDHATLYRGAWLCFGETHARALELAESESWEEFAYELEHFEGPPEAMRDASEADAGRAALPRWYQPAVGGIEFRLDRFQANPTMRVVVDDVFGAPTIADHLAKDLHMEALAAVGLSRVPPSERTPSQISSWARRVFYTAWTLRGRPGQYVDAHRSELVPELFRLLDEATSAPEGESWDVPEVVLEARAVGEGRAPAPTGGSH